MSHSAVAHSLAGPGPARPRPLHRNWAVPAAPAGRLTRPGSGVAAWQPGPLPTSCSPRCLTRPSDLAAGAANSFSMTSLRALFVALVALAAVAHGRKLLRECGGRLVCRRRRGQCAWVSCGDPALRHRGIGACSERGGGQPTTRRDALYGWRAGCIAAAPRSRCASKRASPPLCLMSWLQRAAATAVSSPCPSECAACGGRRPEARRGATPALPPPSTGRTHTWRASPAR